MPPTRRAFLRQMTQWGALGGAARLLAGCGRGPAPEIPYQPTDQAARVAAVRGLDLRTMVRDALEALGGIATLVHPGETVFLKPNFSGAGIADYDIVAVGEATKPEIVVAVAEACLEVGAAKVIIGEGAQVQQFDWERLATLDGETNLAAEVARLNARFGDRVLLACLNRDSPDWDLVTSPYSGLNEIAVSSLVTRADRIISLPVLKTHRWTVMTAALKNFVGVASLARYTWGPPYRMDLHYCPGGIDTTFVDLVAALQPDLTLVDVSVCCEGNGPNVYPGWWGRTLDMRDRLGDWLLLAGTDLVAADATAARVMGQDPANIRQLTLARQLGLGQTDPDRIALLGATLDELQVEWRPASPARDLIEGVDSALAWLLHW